MDDVFGMAGVRERVLAGWTRSPARFREDANAEEDYALGGYRDRVVIELAQNAADAALRAGVPGLLRFTLRDGVLTAANTGAPLDAAGVEALSTLRASAKRSDAGATGRFGVGFTAVVAVTDRPSIDGVEWSAVQTRELVEGIPELAEELQHRDGHVPVLRLPFAVPSVPEPGFDTVVRLPLRDDEAEESVRRGLQQAGPALLLALPALRSVEIEIDGVTRTLSADSADPADRGRTVIDGREWRTAESHGTLDPRLLDDRPTEERARPAWQVRWAVPAGGGLPGDVPAVLHAPTPSAEPIGLPALLLASFPLAPDRRHVAAGPLTDFLIERAAEAYTDLLRDLGLRGSALLDMVPGPIASGALDARLRRAVLALLPDKPLLPGGVRGRDAVAVDAPVAFLEVLSEVLPGLLTAGWPVRHTGLAALGVRRLDLADVVDSLAALDRDPAWWGRLYESLTGADLEALGAMPVPLVPDAAHAAGFGGDHQVRMVRGPRGLLIAADGVDPAALSVLGLRFVHPDAVHPLLRSLGAIEAGPREILADPAVRAAVEDSFDADDPGLVAEAVLSLLAAAHLDAGDEPWLADLALPGADGELYAAGELLLPGSPLGAVLGDDTPFGVVAQELADRHGVAALEAAGVLGTFGMVREQDVALTDLGLDLDGEDAWVDETLDRLPDQPVPPLLPELLAVRDLELVENWAAALALLAEPPLRAAVVDPVYVLLGDGRRATVPSYTAWWLRRHPILNGHRPGEVCTADADPLLSGLYDVVPAGLDAELLRALGVRTSVAELLDSPGGADELLDRLADPSRPVGRAQLRALWAELADAAPQVSPPEVVRAVADGIVEVVPVQDALVLDRPDLLPLLAGQPLVITSFDRAVSLAELLDVGLASDELPGAVQSTGTETAVPPVLLDLLPEAPGSYVAHEKLIVDGHSVPWWYDGNVHVGGSPEGLARGLAWAAGRWGTRFLAEAVLRSPLDLPVLLAESDLDP